MWNADPHHNGNPRGSAIDYPSGNANSANARHPRQTRDFGRAESLARAMVESLASLGRTPRTGQHNRAGASQKVSASTRRRLPIQCAPKAGATCVTCASVLIRLRSTGRPCRPDTTTATRRIWRGRPLLRRGLQLGNGKGSTESHRDTGLVGTPTISTDGSRDGHWDVPRSIWSAGGRQPWHSRRLHPRERRN